MGNKPIYEELEKRVKDLEDQIFLSQKEYESRRQKSKYRAIFNGVF